MNISRLWLSPFFVAIAGCGSAGASNPASHETNHVANVNASGDAGGITKASSNCPRKDTGFPGDDMCLEPPASAQGFQLHYGPDDYDDPEDVAKFVLQPGEETNDCFFELTPNEKDVYYGGYDIQMRPGSHHLIGQSRAETAPRQGFDHCEGTDENPAGLFGASQTPEFDLRQDPASENEGLARLVPARTQAVINFHVINATSAPILREAWMNYFFIDAEQVRGYRGSVTLTGGLGFAIQPGTHETYKYSCSPSEPVRILALASHMHAHSRRMTVYKVADALSSKPAVTKLLENYSWEDPAQFYFDSAHTIPHADPVTQTPGGDFSGDLIVKPTDAIQWECEVVNDSDKVLTFRNEVFTGEMCLVGGLTVGVDDPMKVTDFTCNRN